ncbi:MAG TPA: ABC transporter substrate-binding protein [Trebonia sp.]|nr:ABC transporter substrate-binding protein [Trebonia sp.]
MVGISDVDHMDYDIGYYSTDYMVLRLTGRQLYGWPATPGKNTTPEPDLATGPPVVTNGGKTVAVTIRSGIMWNTTPARAVTAADVVRGIKRACNPSPVNFGGMADFEGAIVGLSKYCAGYPANAATSATAMAKYIENTPVSGITASGNTITFQLTQAAAWLEGAMTLPPFSAVPIEAEAGLPGTPAVYNHMYSDGPYTITSYTPAKQIKFARNPQWVASTDPLRKAYVDNINVDETGDQTTIYQQMGTNSPSLGMSFDALVPPADQQNLLGQIQKKNPDVNLGSTFSSNPYIVFNTVSPNNGNALQNASVRQALSYALDRTQLIKQIGGPQLNLSLTHVLPQGIDGASDVPSNYDPYPLNVAKAKQMLAAAGFTASHKLTLKFLYRSDSQGSTKLFTNVQTQLNALGVVSVTGVPTNQADFYGKYMTVPASPTNPGPAQKGVWDVSLAGWGPDWYGNAAVSFFNPLFSAPGGYPANGGSNFGYFNSSTVNGLITQALAQPTEAAADKYWAQADEAVMSAAAFYPITDPLQLAEHASYVHNAVYMTQWQNFDPANVWLSTPGS